MKTLRLILVAFALCTSLWAQEIRRPTANAASSSTSIGCTGTNQAGTVTNSSNMYDAGTPPTSTSGTLKVSRAATGTPWWAGQQFTGWATASGAYTALTLNVNGSCTTGNTTGGFGGCSIAYSLNAGSTWTTAWQDLTDPTSQTTYTISIPPGTTLGNIYVAACSQASYDTTDGGATTTTFTIWDIWTSGTLSGSIPNQSTFQTYVTASLRRKIHIKRELIAGMV